MLKKNRKYISNIFKKLTSCVLISASVLGGAGSVAVANGPDAVQNPFSQIRISAIYDDASKFTVLKDADNGNHPKIDSDADSLGWLGTGACVSVNNMDFGSENLSDAELLVEMNRDYSQVSQAAHFDVYAVSKEIDISDPDDLSEEYKIGTQQVLPPSTDHTQYFIKNIPVPDEKLTGTMNVYFKIHSGGFNIKSIQFTRKADPITVDKDNALIYTSEASDFNEALPMGNGFVGAMVYGGVGQERIGLNETTIWTGSPYENNVEGANQNLNSLREQTISGGGAGNLYFWTQKFIDSEKMDSTAYGPSFTGSQKYQLAGELNLKTDHTASSYVRYLDLDSAVATTQYRWNDSLITREYFVSNPDRVMAVRMHSDNKPMTFSGNYDLKGMVNRGIEVEGEDTLVIRGGVNDYRGVKSGIEFVVRVKFIPENGELSHTENTITVSDTTDCTILTTIATNFVSYDDISGDEEKLAENMMDQASGKNYEELKQAHISDYQKLYNRVNIELGGGEKNVPINEIRQRLAESDDPAFVELAYNFDRYLQIAGSRKGSQPTNLQGIWNDQLRPMWDCNYTTNINLQMNYWATLPTNLEECYAPVIEKMKSFQEQGHKTAAELYGITTEGAWTLHHNSDLWSVTGPVAGDWGMTPTAGAWMSNEAYNVYLYNQDREYLEEIYPVIKGAAQFMLEFLVEKDGQLTFCPSSSPEIANKATGQFASVNSAFDIQVTTELFQNVIEAAEKLNQDHALVEQLETALDKLPPVAGIGSWGQVQEFYNYDGDIQSDNHRHISHLYGVFPGTTITEENEEYWNAAYNTLKARSAMVSNETLTGWSIAWRIIQFACFGDEEQAYEFVKTMYDMSYDYCLPNLFTVCPPFQYDANGGMLQAVTSMLVADQNGAQLLKGLPDQWDEGSVKGLRLKGDFVLDELTWKEGKLVSATVTSNSGQPLNLRYGDKKVTMDTIAGQTYIFDENLETELPAPVDKTELNKVIEQAEAVLKSDTLSHDYEKKAIDGLKRAYDAAVEVKNREAAEQEEIDAAKTVLSEALSELNQSKKDWGNLETLLKEGGQILKDIKAGKYTEETAEAYQKAYNSARSLKDEATQSEINDAVKALEKAGKELDIAEPTGGKTENSEDPEDANQDQSSSDKPENNQSGSVQTGDDSKLFVWIMLLIIATAGCSAMVYLRKR